MLSSYYTMLEKNRIAIKLTKYDKYINQST